MTPFRTGRRPALLASIAALAAPAARAQPRPPEAGTILPPALPCPRRAEDFAALLLEGPSDAGVVVFGHAFRPGDLPAGAGLEARAAADGRPLPVQFDRKVRHPDGSARHGVVAVLAPALSAGQRFGVLLGRGAPPTGAPLALEAALAGRSARLEVTPLPQGRTWTVDLLELWAAQRGRMPWQSGPLVVEDRLTIPVPPAAVAEVTSMRLVADLALRADGTLWADVWMRNDIVMRPGGGEAEYRLRLLLDGREVLAAELPRQLQYTAFGRQRAARRGAGQAPRLPMVRQDPGYLADTAALPRYDQTIGVDPRVLDILDRQRQDPNWQHPLSNRLIMQTMGAGGGRDDIGPVTGWQSHWLTSGDRRPWQVMLDQAETAGLVPWFMWDLGGGRRPEAWMDTRAWPGLWSDPRGRPPRGGLLQTVRYDARWHPVRSHQPDLSFVPYLVTGRRAFLDNLLAQASWAVLDMWPAMRRPAGAEDLIMLHGSQVRSYAWAMRQLSNAEWIAPEDDESGRFQRHAAAANWAWARAQIPAWTEAQGGSHGWVPGNYGQGGVLPPWQQDYLASTVALAARRGSADARALLAWMSNFLVGRFFAEAEGFPRADGVAYGLAITEGGTGQGTGRTLRGWSEIAAATRALDWHNDAAWRSSRGDYARWALQSLAQIHETLGDPRALEAYRWILQAGAFGTDLESHARSTQLNIISRGHPRVPSRVQRCS